MQTKRGYPDNFFRFLFQGVYRLQVKGIFLHFYRRFLTRTYARVAYAHARASARCAPAQYILRIGRAKSGGEEGGKEKKHAADKKRENPYILWQKPLKT